MFFTLITFRPDTKITKVIVNLLTTKIIPIRRVMLRLLLSWWLNLLLHN